MRRRLFTFASVVSLLLCMASVALWVRSYSLRPGAVDDGDTWTGQNSPLVEFDSTDALLGLRWGDGEIGPEAVTWHIGRQFIFRKTHPLFIAVPHWFPMVFFLILPWVWVNGLLTAWYCPSRSDCCRTCSYNLTGNTSGVCPECGTAVLIQHRGR